MWSLAKGGEIAAPRPELTPSALLATNRPRTNAKESNTMNRPKDLIDYIEALVAENGHFEPVDEDYYQAFLELTQPQIEI